MNDQNVNEKKTHGQQQNQQQTQSGEPMIPVVSTAFTHVRYNPDTKVLTILFNSGNEKRYHNLSEETFKEFTGSTSMGGFFAENIRNNPAYNEQQEQVA